MAPAIIATKLFVPRVRRDLVVRQRLSERLSASMASRLTLVSGPAGFGKTTLLATWLPTSEPERAVAWLSLDVSDDDPATFWRYVVRALDAALPGGLPVASELADVHPLPAERVVAELINDLSGAAQAVWLVLDDFHAIQSRPVHDGVAFLIDHLPPRVHVVLSTRVDPDMPLARWRARGELTELRVADLRFTAEETSTFLNGVSGLDLPAADVDALGQRTEGWIAALQLAALSLQGCADRSDFIARFAGNDKYVVDYLVDEVLAHQTPQVRDFLLQTAILDRLTGTLCDALTSGDHGRDLLLALERANLFLFPMDNQREWFRYHHLFAEVLRARLYQEYASEVRLLHGRASSWFEVHGNAKDAVRHALAAQDFDRAAYLIETALPSIRQNREDSVLVSWLSALPDDAVRRSPVLSVYFGWMLMAVSGDLAGVEARLDDAERALAAAGDARSQWADTNELHTLPATIATHRASLAQARGLTDETRKHAQHALTLAGPEDHLARGAATGFLGLAAWAVGDVKTSLRTFTEAVASLRAAGNLTDALSSTVVLADMWLAAGRPRRARRLFDEALAQAEAQGAPFAQTSALLRVGLSEIDLQAGDLPSARVNLDMARALDDHVSVAASHYRWFLAMGLLAQAEGDRAAANSHLHQALALYRPGFFVDVRPIPAVQARVWLRQGDLSPAEEWAQGRDWSTAGPGDYLAEFDHLTYVRLLLAQHRARAEPAKLDLAVHLLNQLLEPARAAERWGSVVEVHLLRALTCDARGHHADALRSLGHAFAEAVEPEGYARLLLDEGEPMSVLLREAQRRGVAGSHPARLLARSERPARSQLLVDPLSDRELQVLRLLDSELTGPEIARTLFVSHNTVRTHTRHIFAKLRVTRRRAAVQRAREQGLI